MYASIPTTNHSKNVVPAAEAHDKNDHEGRSNQHEGIQKLRYEKRYPLLCLKESQWKLRQ